MKRDYYEVLGLQKGAADHEIKSAFRRLAKEFHPDRNPGSTTAEINFKEVNEAYEALKDPQKRAAYDQFGHAAFEGPGTNGASYGFGSDFSASMSEIFDDLFGEFMGGRRSRGRSTKERGSDLKYNMEISLAEAFTGKSAQIRVPASVTCEFLQRHRRGSGVEPGDLPILSGFRQSAGESGLFHHRAHLHDLPGARRDHSEAVPSLLGQRPGDARARFVGQHPGRR